MEREQQRGTLLRSVAHDLRSPLTAISGAGNLLADIRCSPMPSAESLPLISVRKLCG
ncbi:histidine kinase dimerization/phospho-acceptor domain-containing protein [uncultured Oscillibacter sp.]|uniref:histidine kinase dimerization/phospho-acceptor domain-containing protein n=1 Tax=uncultured Oscillibacter sp. TaxID=876091 RepID=UPI00345C8057